ncbi:hypothetical protein SRHO_G00099180 [Serrasalmus rhombeus]
MPGIWESNPLSFEYLTCFLTANEHGGIFRSVLLAAERTGCGTCGTIRLCLLQRTLADLRSVHPGENITLHCEITADYEISCHNINEDHYEGTEDTRSVSLVIVGVKESDLGLYYCGGRNNTTSIQFGKAFRLTFGDEDFQRNGSSAHSDSEPPPDYNDNPLHWIIIIVLTSVCLVQMSVIFLCAFCHRVAGECCTALPSNEKVSENLL